MSSSGYEANKEHHLEGPSERNEVLGYRYADGRWQTTPLLPALEMPLTIYVNGSELATLLCTPNKLNCLVLGFLFAEGLIAGPGEVALLRVCSEEHLADVRLNRPVDLSARKRVLTSGCGGGTTTSLGTEGLAPISSTRSATAGQLLDLMRSLLGSAPPQRRSGVHVSALCDGRELLVVAEDVGRHNTLDKIAGESLLRGLPTQDRLLITTGRLSSEMALKAAKMGVPIVASRNSVTDRALRIAESLNITLVGYLRGRQLVVYTGAGRIRRLEEERHLGDGVAARV